MQHSLQLGWLTGCIRHTIIRFLVQNSTKMAGSFTSNDGLEEIVRRRVREELENSRGNCTTQTLVNRTRNLIRSSASFAARQLGETSQQPVQSALMPTCRSAPAMSARALDRSTSLTGHPLRKRKAPASRQKAHVVPKTVFLLDEVKINVDDEEEDAGENEEYIIKEEMILVKGEFDLLTGANEQTIEGIEGII